MSHSHQRICARCQTLSAGPAWPADLRHTLNRGSQHRATFLAPARLFLLVGLWLSRAVLLPGRLRRLSAARPDVCPMPQALPATHTGGGEGGGSDRHGERGGRGVGRGGERAGKGGGGKGGETGSRSKDRPRGAGRGGAADGSSDEPPLPDGYDFARWEQGQPVLEFLIWCASNRRKGGHASGGATPPSLFTDAS